MAQGTFATAINCMDGRVQDPVTEWMRSQYAVDYVDMITEAGPTKYMLEADGEALEALQAKVRISAHNHGSEVIAIVAHHDCAGNPVSKEEQYIQVRDVVEMIQAWDMNLKVIGLFVNENWTVETITEV
ncbi:carbonic anhydrase [Pontibacillus salicampi]|uniref:Carbonic anhydrase n=1 Tax=Pontibacillus salicampi TaxID=1449801 RepID=A0ABV6LMA2_9BACI